MSYTYRYNISLGKPKYFYNLKLREYYFSIKKKILKPRPEMRTEREKINNLSTRKAYLPTR